MTDVSAAGSAGLKPGPTERSDRRPRWPFVAAGVLAAGTGLGLGHLVGALVNPAASPLAAVGSGVVDATPTPVKEWAVAALGTADKPVLVVGIAVLTALVAGAAGALVPRRPGVAGGLLLGLAALATIAAVTRPAAVPADALPGLVAGGVSLLTLRWLGTLAGQSARGVGRGGLLPRRSFLVASGATAAAGVTAGLLGHRLGTPAMPPSALPAPARSLLALPPGLERTVSGVSALQTPVEEFYRIDISLVVPRVDTDGWRLHVDGMVARPFSVSYDELRAIPLVAHDMTLTCVSNEIGGPYVGSARWLGVRVADLLRRAGPTPGADQVLSTGVDGFTASTPLEVLLDGREALVALGMNGAPLDRTHGAPARLITPGVYGFVGATKWLIRLTVTTFAEQRAYWTQRGWAEQAPVKTATRIDTPRSGLSVSPGQIAVGGVAWATHRGVSAVQLRVDDGPWQRARLGPDLGVDYWRQWYLPWQAAPGDHRLTARAIDGDGTVQPQEVQGVLPDGPTGWHEVQVRVGT
ncbi:MAG TPA: molybdopterin-dependent oxidoreductase [Dermatophilaceae bacterium]|nr:molybdopterin-dependent oxidoreductase [Dermatophilaceae bacterium]